MDGDEIAENLRRVMGELKPLKWFGETEFALQW